MLSPGWGDLFSQTGMEDVDAQMICQMQRWEGEEKSRRATGQRAERLVKMATRLGMPYKRYNGLGAHLS